MTFEQLVQNIYMYMEGRVSQILFILEPKTGIRKIYENC